MVLQLFRTWKARAAARRTPRSSAAGVFLGRWSAITFAGALLVSTADALLLQRADSFFTGGFLSVDYLQSAGAIAAFIAVSLVSDAAVLGALAAVVLWLLCRAAVRTGAAAAAALAAAAVPLIVADVLSYELLRYLGDAADLSLMLELAGGSVGELLAVASSHLVAPALLAVGVGTAAGGVVWAIHRYSRGERSQPAALRVLIVPALVSLGGLVLTTAAAAADDAMENGIRRKPSGKLLTFVADRLTDVDRDGYGIAARLSDPDPLDALVFPYAVDRPGNGIDENGVGGDLPAGLPAYVEPSPAAARWAHRPDVVLIVLESFRADVLQSHHAGRPVTPVLDSLAERGASSRQAYSHNGYTAQSRYHLLSGSVGGVRDGRTLIDDFKANGYEVAYFSGQDESFGAAEYRVGFDRADVAYDARIEPERRYSTFTTAGSLAIPFGLVQQRVGEFLQRTTRERPLFLYVNFHDTHFPYTHDAVETIVSPVRLPRSGITPASRDDLWATYVNTAANVDRAIGTVLADVRRVRGAEPAVIVTADHGESLFDEGFLGHGYALNDVQTRVPLVVANLPVVIGQPFAQADLRDVIAAALSAPPGAAPRPRVHTDERRRIFQYLGSVARPRQIAFLGAGGRTIYDFRTSRARFGDGPWEDPRELSGQKRTEFLALVWEWERMVLARRAMATLQAGGGGSRPPTASVQEQ